MKALLLLVLAWLACAYGVLFLKVRPPGSGGMAADVASVLDAWPRDTRRLATRMLGEHGPPSSVSTRTLCWELEDGGLIVVSRAGDPDFFWLKDRNASAILSDRGQPRGGSRQRRGARLPERGRRASPPRSAGSMTRAGGGRCAYARTAARRSPSPNDHVAQGYPA